MIVIDYNVHHLSMNNSGTSPDNRKIQDIYLIQVANEDAEVSVHLNFANACHQGQEWHLFPCSVGVKSA